jgi:uracil phosphoribosyltransferase
VRGITVIDHPLVQHGLVRLRDPLTGRAEFRRVLAQVSVLLVYEAARHFATRPVRVRTPLATARGSLLRREIVLVPVLRAGLGMLQAVLDFFPDARVGFIGLSRDEQTLEARRYHLSLAENLKDCEVVLIDPMLATGGSAVSALELIHQRGATRVHLVNLLAAPAGLRRVRRAFPHVPIVTAAIDRKRDARGFIVPGLGDAGDRLFGL